MKKISYREFQKQMCKLKGEDWEVVGRGGRVIGRWKAAVDKIEEEEEEDV